MRRRLFKNLITAPCTEAVSEATAGFEAAGEELRGVIARTLGRSLAIREVDAGSCNGCELEIHALGNAFYDIERFGIRFVASPRHADVLLVTGPVTLNMREARFNIVLMGMGDLVIRGCPPTPTQLLQGLVWLLGGAPAAVTRPPGS